MQKFLLLLFSFTFLVSCNNKEDDPQPDTNKESNASLPFKKYTIKNAKGSIIFQQECKYDDKARLTELLQTYNDQLNHKYQLEYNEEGLMRAITIKRFPIDDLGIITEGEETKYLYEYQDGLVARVFIQSANSVPSLSYEYTYQGKNLKTFKAIHRAYLYEYDEYNAGGRPGARRQYRIKNDSLLLIGKRSYGYDGNNNLISQTNMDSLTTQPRVRYFENTFNTEKLAGEGSFMNLLPSTDNINGVSEDVNRGSKDRNKNFILSSKDTYRMKCTGTNAESNVIGTVAETSNSVFDHHDRLISFRYVQTDYVYEYSTCTSSPGEKIEQYTTIEY